MRPVSPSSPTARVRDTVRALVRQLSAAVYALVLFAVAASLLPLGSYWGLVVEVGVVGLIAAVVARLVEGALWTVALVGPFVALLDLGIVLLSAPEGPAAVVSWALFAIVVPPLVGGGLGTFAGRKLQARTAAAQSSP